MRDHVTVPFKGNPVPMFVYRIEDLQIVDVNAAALDLYGYDREQMLRMSITDLRPDEKVSGLMKWLEDAPSQARDSGVWEHQTADGDALYVQVSSQPTLNNEETRLVILMDVTSNIIKRRQNRLLSSVARRTTDGVVITGPDKRIQWVNEAWLRMTGYRLQEAKGEKPGDLMQGPDTKQETIDFMSEKLSAGEGFTTRILNYKKDGTSFWNDLEVQPVYDEEGNLQQWIGIKEDVTKQLEAYKREKQTKQWFHRAMDMAPFPVMMRDETGEVRFINRAWQQQSGYRPEELPTVQEWADKAHKKLEQKARQKIEEVFKHEGVYHNGEFPVTTKQGERKIWDFWEANLGALPGEEHQIAVVMAVDMTDLREAQQHMRVEYQKFNQLFEHAPDGILITDDQGEILQVNSAFTRLFGYTYEGLKGQNIDRLLTRTDEEYKEARRYTRRLKRGEKFREETVRYTKEGHRVHVNIGGAVVEIDNETQYLFHIYTDVTERKQAEIAHRKTERELSTLFSNLPGMAYRCRNNRNYTMLFVSEGCRNLTGYDPDEVVNDKKVAYGSLIHPDDRDLVWNRVQTALEQKDHFEIEYRIYTKDNKEKWVWERGTVLNTNEDKQVTLQGIISDISERKKQQQELEKLLKQKKNLIQEIHHRVKNNLAVITGLLYMQMEQATDEQVKSNLKDAYGRIQSIAMVHEQLYQQAEKDTDINMGTYMPELFERLQQIVAIPEEKIATEFEAASVHLPLNRAVSVGLLTSELLINAYKHAFRGRQEGHIRLTLTEGEDGFKLQVTDDGVGLPEDFGPESGTMGVQIINSLVNQLDGELSYESEPGEGTTFTVRIPNMEDNT